MDKASGILPSGLESFAIKQTEKSKGDAALGQEQFLELMVAQLNNQDPMNPMESGDFLGQLAQFGTVNGITELQSSFEQLAGSLQSNQALEASTMVGRSVLVPGDSAYWGGQAGGISGAIELTEATGEVILNIQDAAGQSIKHLSLGAQSEGLVQFTWDGLDDAGVSVPSGNYRFSVEAQVNDQNVSFPTLIQGKVESVSLIPGGGEPQLNLSNIGAVNLGHVRQVL